MPHQTHQGRGRSPYIAPVLVVALLLAATAANVAFRFDRESEAYRQVELREHEDLPTLIARSSRTVRLYYSVYMDLLEVAAGSELRTHPDAPIVAIEARGLAQVRTEVDERYDPRLSEAEASRLLERPHRDGVLWVRGEREDVRYVIVEPPSTPTSLRTMRADGDLFIVDESTLADVRDADGGA